MTQTSRSEDTEHPPAVFTPHDLLRLRRLVRLFDGMPYAHCRAAELDNCKTVGDLIGILERVQTSLAIAAADARRTKAELRETQSALRGGVRLRGLALDLDETGSPAAVRARQAILNALLRGNEAP